MAIYYPPVGFHFKVEVLGISPNESDTRFTEVSGLSVEAGMEEVAEGGENRFIQKYPVNPKYSDLILKRGLLVHSEVTDWILRSINDLDIQPKNVDVTLLNDKHEPLVTWHLVNAYPVKWVIGDFNASENAVVVETLQLYYQYFTVDKS
ncbi:MAG: phage tail protein [Bacteroidales bacterium]|nr:phage tail protein [Bacteroidales bacterium]